MSAPDRICADGLPCPAPDLPPGYRCDGCDCERAEPIETPKDGAGS